MAALFLSACQYMVGSPAYNKRVSAQNTQEKNNTPVTKFVCDQYDTQNDKDYFVVVDNMPVLQGGLGELQRNVIYPPAAWRAGIEGRVTVQFIVNERGYVVCPQVIRGISDECDLAAVNAVSTARFTPGMQRGRPVPVQYSLPIVFRIN